MAQARNKRKQRAKRRSAGAVSRPGAPSPLAQQRSTRLRRVVIAFLVLVGLAGILAVSAPSDDGSGAPRPGSAPEPSR